MRPELVAAGSYFLSTIGILIAWCQPVIGELMPWYRRFNTASEVTAAVVDAARERAW
jgi:hypothetical protein